MRLRFSVIIYILVLSSVWSQDIAAGASEPASTPSAFDILGVNPLTGDAQSPETIPLSVVDAALVSIETPVVDEAIITEDVPAATANESVAADEPSVEEEASIEKTDVVEEGAGVEETAVVEEEVAGEEIAAVEENASVEETAVVEEGATVEEPAVVEEAVVTEGISEAGTADELVLMAEIERLLAERDELYGAINELRAENIGLAEQASDAEFYKNRVAELEFEITRLEGIIVENESALAAADLRLSEIEALLVEEGALLADAEARLAMAGGDTEAVSSMLAQNDAELTEKNAEIAVQAAEISVRNATITIKDAELSDKAAIIASKEDELRAKESTIAAKDEAIAAMTARLEAAQAEAAAALAAAKAAGTVVQVLPITPAPKTAPVPVPALAPVAVAPVVPVTPAPATAVPATDKGYLSGWKLDTSRFTKKLRDGFDGSSARMGSWKIAGATASQSDASQYFSRLELPLAQGKAPMLYRFKARSTGKGWIGLGLHLYVEDVLKKRGYGEGKSLLVWFTRDPDARGDAATYLQLYRSDDDVVMERMFDAELQDGIDAWRLVEVVYDPGAEYIAVSVDGVLRIVYKTFFGRNAGATAALRTLGGGVSFSEFSAWTE